MDNGSESEKKAILDSYKDGRYYYKCPNCGDVFEYDDVVYQYDFVIKENTRIKSYSCKRCRNCFILPKKGE